MKYVAQPTELERARLDGAIVTSGDLLIELAAAARMLNIVRREACKDARRRRASQRDLEQLHAALVMSMARVRDVAERLAPRKVDA